MKIQARGARYEARGKNSSNVILTTSHTRGDPGIESIPRMIGAFELLPGASRLVPRPSCLAPLALPNHDS